MVKFIYKMPKVSAQLYASQTKLRLFWQVFYEKNFSSYFPNELANKFINFITIDKKNISMRII